MNSMNPYSRPLTFCPTLRLVLFCSLLFFFPRAGLTLVDIASLHRNDASGAPAAPYQIGQRVQVTGVVTAGTNLFTASYCDVYIQDATGGINLYAASPWPTALQLGDSIRVDGVIRQFRGLSEISTPMTIEVLGKALIIPSPLPVTCDQVANSFAQDFSEANESRLIRINQVRVVAGSAPTLTISDQTGQCLLYLDADTNLPVPQGTFDVIGILKQYDSTAPYTDGYEILPRFAGDLILHSGPVFACEPEEVAITPQTVDFYWQTAAAASASIKYKSRTSWEWQSFGDSSAVQEHRLSLTNLQPATIYDAYVVCSDVTGSSSSRRFAFCTASARASGTIEVWFNQSIDPTLAHPDAAHGSVDLAAKLIERIDQARYSLDACFYNLSHSDLTEAIGRAKNRGVSVRLIYEADNLNASISRLEQVYHIPVISDRFGQNSGIGSMHNKFVIIDHRDQSSALDDYLWVASANGTFSGAVLNAENGLIIQDEALCAAYTAEFDEMWGDGDEIADASRSRFGERKTNNTPHRFSVNGVWIEQYMSPSDQTEAAIVQSIRSAQQSLYFCIYSFTSTPILYALEELFRQSQGFGLAGVFDEEASGDRNSVYSRMAGIGASAWSPPANVWLEQSPYLLHHKYLIVDAGGENPKVITGSHNWSYSAEHSNDENTLIFYSRALANQYLQEFSARYQEAGGQAALLTPVAAKGIAAGPATWRLIGNYPNPFNSATRILYHRPEGDRSIPTLFLYDVAGRLVRTLQLQPRGDEVAWDGMDSQGRSVASGVYMVRIGDHPGVVKMLLMR